MAVAGEPGTFLRVGFIELGEDFESRPFIERSDDGGITWEQMPTPTIVAPGAPGLVPANAVHFTWMEVADDGTWHLSGNAQAYPGLTLEGNIPTWAFHTASPDQGQTWSQPRFWPTIARAWPGRVGVDHDTVVMTWDAGDSLVAASVSQDAGASWTDVVRPADCLMQSHLVAVDGGFRFWCLDWGRQARFLELDPRVGGFREVGLAHYGGEAESLNMGSQILVAEGNHLIGLLKARTSTDRSSILESRDGGATWTRWPSMLDLTTLDAGRFNKAFIDCLALDGSGRLHLTAMLDGDATAVVDTPVAAVWVVLDQMRNVVHEQTLMQWQGLHDFWGLEGNPGYVFGPAFGTCAAFGPSGGILEATGSADVLRLLV